MSFFKKEEKSISEEKKVGLVIHITPIAIYLYISEYGTVWGYTNGSGLDMEDADGKYIGINGSYISLELQGLSEIENVIEKFGLSKANLPIIRIDGVKER